MIFQKIINNMTASKSQARRAELYRDLIRHEAKIGGQLFGPVQEGGRREFFCLDETTWVWHEEWKDQNNQVQIRTTRYDVRPHAILKSQDGNQFQSISADEARHIRDAAKLYLRRVNDEMYHFAI